MTPYLKILLICDLENWILGQIAFKLAEQLSDYLEITVLITHSQHFLGKFTRNQRKYDIVHYLSPWDYFQYIHLTYRPCVVTLWHMVNWDQFDKDAARIDSLFIGSLQWRERVKTHIPSDLPCEIMQYGLDPSMFKRDPHARDIFLSENHLPDNTIVLGFAGSALSNEYERKGLDRIWKLLAQLINQTDLAFFLRFIGVGWSEEIVPIELRKFVKIEPYIEQSELSKFYSSLDYYLCTSRYEGVPYPVIEAMSCECTIISTPVGVVPEIIEHGYNGFIIKEQSLENDFMQIMSQTAGNPEFRKQCGENARRTIEGRFNWDITFQPDIFLQLYRSALEYYYSRSIIKRTKYYIQSYYELYPHQLGVQIIRFVKIPFRMIKNRLIRNLP